MAEANGTGRMDRVEAALDRLAAAQEYDYDNIVLLHSVAKMQGTQLNDMAATWQKEREADLVRAIGTLIKHAAESTSSE